ncbi:MULTISPECIES: ABC transporter substrate-binding protein [Oceanimonas]|uniref:Nickel/dipeptide/oligopeptide ABC transporter substrate-binding protein n=1 Tax=Oceanimonas doudoroffii TaxID=84158 RepID=A0A233RBP6_9GAMM|nr:MULTISPECIES: ABC transporter substrate-binding protein [Oceanimonas]NHI02226.1 Periplasmic dipeptide transport protein [Oceanimonas sp. MB9]OXY80820.1 nickel/dipeptide/oligopeptide ABC transporter substrate-binding protein [Oceanimonas doudoroffii]
MKKGLNRIAAALVAAGVAFSAQAADITIAYDADPVSMDPHEQLSGATLELSHLVFDPLVRWTKDFKFEARLAEKWERVDDNTMRFHLRQGVTFHSGNPFTADDVIWTFNRLKTSPDFKALFEPFSEAKKVDEHTVDLVTKGPFPLVLNTVTYLFPMDSKFYTGTTADGKDKGEVIKHGSSFASTNPSGTGPFKLKFRQQGVKVEYERNADYWDTSSPGNVNNMTLVPIKEDATRVAALLAGDVDFIKPVSPNDHKRVESASGVKLVTEPGTRIITFQMNQDRFEPFRDVRVRQAVNYAINQEGIVKRIMRGFATTAGQQAPAGYVGHNPELVPLYDLDKAKALMAEAGYADGFKISMIAPNNRYVNDYRIAEAVKAMLARINIDVELKTMPVAQYWPEFDKCSADMLMIGWHSDTEDTANFSEFLTMTRNEETGRGQYNCGHYANPALDKLIEDANVETDGAKRESMLQQAEKMLYDDAAFVPLHWQNLAWGARDNVNAEPIVNAMDFPYLGDLVVKE